jgi:hypothetical protein
MSAFFRMERLAFILTIVPGIAATFEMRAQAEPSFDVTISSPARVFVTGSLIRLDVTIANRTDHVLLLRSSRCGPKAAGITIRGDQQNALEPRREFREAPDQIPCNLGGGVTPSKSVTESVVIGRWFDLSRPGRYSIQLDRRIFTASGVPETRKSNILEIEIVAGKSDRLARYEDPRLHSRSMPFMVRPTSR